MGHEVYMMIQLLLDFAVLGPVGASNLFQLPKKSASQKQLYLCFGLDLNLSITFLVISKT